MTDPRDGHTYKTVKIGEQIWMAENMRYAGVKHYSVAGKRSNDVQYGYLYTWNKAKKACPAGWHLPTKSDFEQLLSASGAEADASNIRALFWKNGSNSSGFAALPVGLRRFGGDFNYFGSFAPFWSSTPDGDYYAYRLGVLLDYAGVVSDYRDSAFSVHCLQDSD